MRRIRIGGHDPRFRNIGGRDMRGIDRMFQLFVSLQILFGSRRGFSVVLPLLLLAGLVAVGWFTFNSFYSPQQKLEQAHADWDSGVSTQQISAIQQYKKLLQMDNPIEPGMRWLQNDRDTLYRRIIEHQVLYEDKFGAREWIIKAWDEGIRDPRFAAGQVNDFWIEATDSLRNRGPLQMKQPASSTSPTTGVIDDDRLNGILAPSGN